MSAESEHTPDEPGKAALEELYQTLYDESKKEYETSPEKKTLDKEFSDNMGSFDKSPNRKDFVDMIDAEKEVLELHHDYNIANNVNSKLSELNANELPDKYKDISDQNGLDYIRELAKEKTTEAGKKFDDARDVTSELRVGGVVSEEISGPYREHDGPQKEASAGRSILGAGAGGSAGMFAGAAAGFMVGGPAGALIGGAIGMLAGGAAGKVLAESAVGDAIAGAFNFISDSVGTATKNVMAEMIPEPSPDGKGMGHALHSAAYSALHAEGKTGVGELAASVTKEAAGNIIVEGSRQAAKGALNRQDPYRGDETALEKDQEKLGNFQEIREEMMKKVNTALEGISDPKEIENITKGFEQGFEKINDRIEGLENKLEKHNDIHDRKEGIDAMAKEHINSKDLEGINPKDLEGIKLDNIREDNSKDNTASLNTARSEENVKQQSEGREK